MDTLEKIVNDTLKELKVENLIKTKNISDGYHTFGQLYHDRAILFAIICNTYKDNAWKSKLHDDGTMFDDMFIVGVATPHRHYTYHFHINPYWDMYDVMEIDYAPKWDGHTYKDIDRLFGLLNN